MRSLKKSGKYDLQKLKKDALGSLTAVGWIFPLALAFGSNSPFGAAAGIVGAIAACIIGSGSPNRIPTPHVEVFAILIYAANTIGVPRRDALLHYCGYAPALCRNYSVQ